MSQIADALIQAGLVAQKAEDALRQSALIRAQNRLPLAARRGDLDGLRQEIENGADPKLFYGDRTALMIAACARPESEACVRFLIPLSDPAATSDAGDDALMFAARYGHAEVVRALLPVCDPLRVESGGQSALAMAAAYCQAQALEALIPVSNPLQADLAGATPLILAAQAGFPDGVRLLLPVSDPAATDVRGADALWHAVHGDESRELCNEHVDCVEALAERASLERLLARNSDGKTLVELASETLGWDAGRDARSLEIADALLRAIARKERAALAAAADSQAGRRPPAAIPLGSDFPNALDQNCAPNPSRRL
jgi:hypothetical protein